MGMENVTLAYAAPTHVVRMNALGIGGVLLAAFGVCEMGLGGWLGLGCAFACLLGAVGAFGFVVHDAGVVGEARRKWDFILALLLVCAIGAASLARAELQMLAFRELLVSAVRDPLRAGGRGFVMQGLVDGVRCLMDLMGLVLCGMGILFMRRVRRAGGPRGIAVVSAWALGLILLLLMIGVGADAAGVLLARSGGVFGRLGYDNPYVSVRSGAIDAAHAVVTLYGVLLAAAIVAGGRRKCERGLGRCCGTPNNAEHDFWAKGTMPRWRIPRLFMLHLQSRSGGSGLLWVLVQWRPACSFIW